MVILYAILVVLFIYLRKVNEKRVEKQKLNCVNCGEKILPFAINCTKCGHQQTTIFDIGFLGNRKATLITDKRRHKFNLLAQRRCPSCATKSEKRSAFQKCSVCGTEFFENPTINDFIVHQDKKFKMIFLLSFIIGLIPIVGFVICASLVGINLLSPYRKYISKTGTFFSKMLIRLLTVLFFIFGVGFGFVAAPVYCLIRYTIIKNQFKLANGVIVFPNKNIVSTIS
jgi:DNA-directed RNA polymerase subunit RPC12/RpoP